MRTVTAFRSFPLPVQVLLVNQFGVNAGFYMLVPYLTVYLTGSLGLSVAVTGIILGLRNLSQQGLFLVGGAASDRLGARRVIIVGCALRVVGFGLFALSTSVPVLVTASIVTGLAGALFNPAVRAYISVSASDRRSEAFALFNVFAQAGALAGPLIGSALLSVDFTLTATVAAALFAILTVIQMVALPAHSTPPSGGTVLSDIAVVATNRNFLLFTASMLGMFVLQSQLYLVFPVLVRRATDQTAGIAAVFVATTVLAVLTQVRVTDWLNRHVPRHISIAGGLAVMGLAFAPAMLAPTSVGEGSFAMVTAMIPILVSALLLELGVILCSPFVLEIIGEFATESTPGITYGAFYLVSGLTAAAGNTVIGLGLDMASGWPGLAVCVAFGVFSGAAVWALAHADRIPRPDRENELAR